MTTTTLEPKLKAHSSTGAVISVCLLVAGSAVHCAAETYKPGLVGVWYSDPGLTNIQAAELIKTLELTWDENSDREDESQWSAKWQGFVVAPAEGAIRFYVETDQAATIEIDGKPLLAVEKGQKEDAGSLDMVKGRLYPITIIYVQDHAKKSYLKMRWSWPGQHEVAVPGEYLRHTLDQEYACGWEPEDTVLEPGTYIKVPVKNVMVYQEPGRFAGWPANNGVWAWGDEILVGFELGYYRYERNSHSIDTTKPQPKVLARSLDGGGTWKMEDPENFVGDGQEAVSCPGDINFTHPDFAMRLGGRQFFVSYSRGKTWQGPYLLNGIEDKPLSSRTDYVVNGPRDCLLFLSAESKDVQAGLQDRSLCARTTDGGESFTFLSWMTGEPLTVRSVMSSTVRMGPGQLVSVMRRRLDSRKPGLPERIENWIDAYQSRDDGKSWQFLSKVADTDKGKHNGNPPSLIRLRDGRLCAAYGYRAVPYGIRVKISNDNGKTWGKEIILRDDALTWDIGYTRMVARPDGKLVTLYYYATQEQPEQHIAATIWDPQGVK